MDGLGGHDDCEPSSRGLCVEFHPSQQCPSGGVHLNYLYVAFREAS